MRTGDRQQRRRRERAEAGETFNEIVRRAARRPTALAGILAVALLLAVVGVLFVPAPFKTAAVGLVGVPVIAWMTRRDHREPSPPGGVHSEEP
jgi:Flp pilus assembly protein TadB